MRKLLDFGRSQLRVRPAWVLKMTTILAIAALLSVPLTELSDQYAAAQQQMVVVPSNNAGAALAHTVSTSLTNTAVMPIYVTPTTGGNQATAQVLGNTNIYGWDIVNTGTATCFVQVFDRQLAAVTVGTTLPLFSIPTLPTTQSSTFGQLNATFISPIPIANTSSTLDIAATTTPYGSSACGTVYVSIAFKK